MMTGRILTAFFAAALFSLAADPALADGFAVPWQINMQDAASPSAERLHEFHEMLLWITGAIVVFIMVLLLYVMLRFNSKVNPEPAKFTHNVPLEVIWTVVPILVLVLISVKSMPMLYYLDRAEEPEMTLKVTGYQWYWGYEYPDQDGLSFLSYMVPEDEIDASKGQKRLLSVDNVVVLPVDTDIAIQITGADVIHSFAVPALGIKLDAVPGRLNETWVRIDKPGTYYGQCSELCGKDHAYMPIEVKAVSKEEFANWLVTAKEQFAFDINADDNTVRLAMAAQ
ncbi:MAG: cytochrome c oxidase subunit II [Alphaproteobacteria bacterium]|nr:cytochrome c oxidase subunit II [Alphaproteobacteria bacterium]